MKNKKGFTLVELLAVIAILAIVMLIAIPTILGVINDAKEDSFRNSVRGVFGAVDLLVPKGITSGNISDLEMNANPFTSGTWTYNEGVITITDVCDKTYCVSSLDSNNKGSEFVVTSVTSNYQDTTLNGADPVYTGNLIPVIISSAGDVIKADTSKEWYNYEEKKWANAVITTTDTYLTAVSGTTIEEADIESYFVWIPRYKYKLWNTGEASKTVHEIEIEFESKEVVASTGGANGEWLTHPAFQFGEEKLNGIWVGKFEIGYKGAGSTSAAEVSSAESSNIVVKPNVYSWRSNTVSNFFNACLSYSASNDSHMMKNTEWGAVAYLSHSIYGINNEVTINSNSSYLTGYANSSSYTYNTENGYKASTTGNITGVYDMSGGAFEYMAAYISGNVGSSGLSNISSYDTKYFDVYNASSSTATYQYRILGDATGEMGPITSYVSSWYSDGANFVNSSFPWFVRGGRYGSGTNAGQFYFSGSNGGAGSAYGSRLVLAK